MPKKIYTTGEVAEILGVAPDTVRRYCNSGQLASETGLLSTHRRIHREALEAFLEKKGLSRDIIDKAVPKRILIADDDKNMLRLLEKTLRGLSLKVDIVCAENGYEACVKAGDFKPDLMIIDLMMPGMKGFEVIGNIRNVEETRGIKIVVITAFYDEENLARAREAGADKVFRKPLGLTELKESVTALLLGRNPRE